MPRKDLPPLKYATPDGWDNDKFNRHWEWIKKLCDERDALARDLTLKSEEIEKAWAKLPATVTVIPFRRCTKCDKPTQERFNGKAYCHHHIRGGSGVAAVLDEFLNG